MRRQRYPNLTRPRGLIDMTPTGSIRCRLPYSRPMKGTVSLRSVTVRYGSFEAVSNLSLDVAAGEFLAILGPSGSGKTTTMRVVGGFVRPDEGSVSISGVDVIDLPPFKRDANTVFQSYALFPHMTRRGQRRLRAADAAGPARAASPPSSRDARARPPLARREAPAIRAVGRDAAARRDRPRAGGQPERAAARRAARRPRPEAARGDAARAARRSSRRSAPRSST